MTAITNYTDVFNNTYVINLSDSRDNFAKQAAAAYCKQFKKRITPQIIQYFERDSGAYHHVRDLLEDIKSDNFNDVLSEFKKLYPLCSRDWQSALKCGLLVKAGEKVGNYSNGEYIYHDATAKLIRSHTLNTLDQIIDILTNNQ